MCLETTCTAASAAHEGSPLLLKEASSSTTHMEFHHNHANHKPKSTLIRVLVLASAAIAGLWLLTSSRTGGSTLPTRNGRKHSTPAKTVKVTRLAFVGNSMFYFNDFPRYFQAISEHLHDHGHHVEQNSCLHGGGSIPSLAMEGNAMWPQFITENAVLNVQHEKEDHVLYDFGACTVPQLLTGVDNRLDDPGYAAFQDVDLLDPTRVNLNPCRKDPAYLEFAKQYFDKEVAQYSVNADGSTNNNRYWDYVLMNDNTKNPGRGKTRQKSLAFLETFYVPWLQQTGATPVFLWTHAYPGPTGPNSTLDLTGFHDIANFTSLTGAGYRAYRDLLQAYLPPSQQPRIAPVGLAFLLVHEEDPLLWQHLFHSDGIHASPSGTFLQGCIMYHTIFGEMPPYDWIVREDMSSLWKTARMMQHSWDPPNPFPTTEIADTLYHYAQRIADGEIPKTYIDYQHGEVAYGVERRRNRKRIR